MKTLDLVLKSRWYEMICEGPKREEYREKSPYWLKRLLSYNKGDNVRFRRGYTSTFRDFRIVDITTGIGRPEWGAPTHEVFIIKFENYD